MFLGMYQKRVDKTWMSVATSLCKTCRPVRSICRSSRSTRRRSPHPHEVSPVTRRTERDVGCATSGEERGHGNFGKRNNRSLRFGFGFVHVRTGLLEQAVAL